ncbi:MULTISPECIES: KEOPS complex subunit Pcc1 [Haloferax]|uniref:KEOPS complex Pcc1-like subunit n=1 Tax=Haloferax marinum TaxID=2666143 RepID=A0A6A8G5Y3_9EURY|nr:MULTISPECIES: KEOPS complex subunit Pcc1 [Haloferax]KAB1197122.1 KEOPS complex Pcc1-like subunit [Haloferax sp. CBA1150]MRW96155.1 KEOPS complex Pcc1-like subunit [Haloferax marinum]
MRPAHSASLEFDYPDERRARIVEQSVAVEVGEIDDARSRAHAERDGRTVVVTVDADDIVALRAGVNTWIRLVETAEAVAVASENRSQTA